MIIRAPNEKGKNPFQVRDIRRSYRIRGSVPRAHRNRTAKNRAAVVRSMSENWL